jgi:DNA-binding CsgD family transcriptional regulator
VSYGSDWDATPPGTNPTQPRVDHRTAGADVSRGPWLRWSAGPSVAAGRLDLASGPEDFTVSSAVPPTQRLGGDLVGRDAELRAVSAFLDEGAAGGATLLLQGEPGVGKTALLDAAAGAAQTAGTLVLRCAGAEFESDIGFSALHQLLLPLQTAISQLGAAHRDALAAALGLSPEQDTDRGLIEEATLRLLRITAERSPVLIVLDDLQWVDRPSTGVLTALTRRLDGTRIGLLAAARTGPGGFFDPGSFVVRDVPPLDDAAASRLLTDRFPGLGAATSQRVLAEAQGNALALLELPTALTDAQHTGSGSLPPVLPLTRRLRAVFAARVGSLPASTYTLLLAAALEGVAEPTILASASAEDLSIARVAGLLTTDPATARVMFRHPLTRSSVVQAATGAQRRQAHRFLAQRLSGDPDRRAWHLGEASIGPETKIADLLEESAQRVLRRGDALGAVATLLRAADLSPLGPDRRRRFSKAAYVGAEVTGNLRSAVQLLDGPHHSQPEPSGALQAAVAAAYVLLSGHGDVDTAHRLLAGALSATDLADGNPDELVTEALQTLLYVCLGGARPELWGRFYDVLHRFPEHRTPMLDLQIRLLADPARTAHTALTELDAAVAALVHETDLVHIERVARVGAVVDRVPACRAPLLRVVDDGRAGGAVASALGALAHLCLADVKGGQWGEAIRLADEGLDLCGRHGYTLISRPFQFARALVAAARGQYATTQALTEEMTRWAAPRGIRGVLVLAWHAQGLAALSSGRFEDAYQLFARISPPGSLASHLAHALWVPMSLVEAAVATDRVAEANAHVEAMHRSDTANLSPRLALLVAGSTAMAATGLEPDLFDAALATPGAADWPFELASIHLSYGQRLRRARSTTAARTQLHLATTLFHELGATPWATRAQSELEATGLTKAPIGQSGLRVLTPQERTVAVLAASGLTNKQIADRLLLSHRTVGSHLHQVFLKLDITARSAIRDALRPLTSGQNNPGP